jgi:hypothetical protein
MLAFVTSLPNRHVSSRQVRAPPRLCVTSAATPLHLQPCSDSDFGLARFESPRARMPGLCLTRCIFSVRCRTLTALPCTPCIPARPQRSLGRRRDGSRVRRIFCVTGSHTACQKSGRDQGTSRSSGGRCGCGCDCQRAHLYRRGRGHSAQRSRSARSHCARRLSRLGANAFDLFDFLIIFAASVCCLHGRHKPWSHGREKRSVYATFLL